MENFFNPAVISVLLLCFLCLKRINVLLSIIISAIVAGFISGMNIEKIMDVFISGMGGNSETALSYILLGTLAAVMAHTGFTNVISNRISKFVSGRKCLLFLVLALIAMASQNIIPIHIAFIPIIIPPLIATMNKLKIDRRAISCILAFGLKMPYITIPVGFGLIFHNLIADNLIQNGVNVVRGDIWKSTIILGIAMLFGLILSLIVYNKPRAYNDNCLVEGQARSEADCSSYTSLIVCASAVVTFIVQLITHSLPLGALVGLGIILSFKVISRANMDKMLNEGIYLMGYVAFVMLVAAGYANVLQQTGAIDMLVNNALTILPMNQIFASLIILLLGLFITLGIGTSFGTIPILAVLFVPICIQMNFNPQQIILLIAAAAALGDAGSPASDTTLGPTSGLNIDGQHNHIYDTCIPTFLHYNIPLIVFALIGIYLLG